MAVNKKKQLDFFKKTAEKQIATRKAGGKAPQAKSVKTIKAKTPFEQLATKRGVNVQQEAARATSQQAQTTPTSQQAQTTPTPEFGDVSLPEQTPGQFTMSGIPEAGQDEFGGIIDAVKGRFGEEVFATTGFKVAGYKPEVDQTFFVSLAPNVFPGKIVNPKTATAAITGPGKFIRFSTQTIGKNTKSLKISIQSVQKFFSPKTMKIAQWWIGSVALGLWAQKEAPEFPAFNKRDIRLEAERTNLPEDWARLDEVNDIIDQASDLSVWEKIGLGTPAAALIGTFNALRAFIRNQDLSKDFEAERKFKIENGLDETAMWEAREDAKNKVIEDRQAKAIEDARIEAAFQEAERDRDAAEDREIRKINDAEDRLRAQESARKIREEAAAFHRKEAAAKAERERKEVEWTAQYWLDYDKYKAEQEDERIKQLDDGRPSSLNFGLI